MANGRRGRLRANSPSPSPDQPQDPVAVALQMLTQIMGEQAASNAAVLQALHRQSTGTPPPGTVVDPFLQGLTEFRKHHPPAFTGAYDPAAADSWLNAMNKIFEVMACADDLKVRFATYMLQGEVENWWKNAKISLNTPETLLSWDAFQNVFLEKYFPEPVRKQKELEFLNLKQGNMTVGQFVAKFEELSKYHSLLQANPNEGWKCSHLEAGLKPEIRKIVSVFQLKDFPALVTKCLVVEQSLVDEAPKPAARTWVESKRKRDDVPVSKNFRPQFQGGKGKQVALPSTTVVPICPKCGKHHRGECLAGQRVCFYCREPNHMIGDCPKRKKDQPKPQATGRVFTLNGEMATQADDLMQVVQDEFLDQDEK